MSKIPTIVHLIPKAKLTLERIAEGAGRPANHVIEDAILNLGARQGVVPTAEEVTDWLQRLDQEKAEREKARREKAD